MLYLTNMQIILAYAYSYRNNNFRSCQYDHYTLYLQIGLIVMVYSKDMHFHKQRMHFLRMYPSQTRTFAMDIGKWGCG